MANLRARGVPIGAKKKMTEDNLSAAERMLLEGMPVDVVARELKVSKPSIYGYFKINRCKDQITVTRKTARRRRGASCPTMSGQTFLRRPLAGR